ncbi:MAG: glycosyltransferase family 2 protein [Bernardetiaceae bacterium]|nr:glycosyltransferase family 2 protein [Bernardetiaceae bacterium]
MSEKIPFFSVVIPTYNRANRLSNTLDSVLNQSYQNFELILVDDGSTDQTAELIHTHYKDNVRYLPKKNEERSIARNYGFAHAKGEFVVFFDSDDYMHENHLQTLKEAILEHKDYHIFATKFQINTNGKLVRAPVCALAAGSHDYKSFLKGSFLNALFAIRRSLKVVPFPADFNLCEDWIFCVLNTYQNPLYLIDAITITVIDHDGRSMMQNQKLIEARVRATQKLITELELSNKEKQILQTHSYRFCAIHAYLDYNRKKSLYFAWKALSKGGLSFGNLILLVKVLIGKKWIKKIKK